MTKKRFFQKSEKSIFWPKIAQKWPIFLIRKLKNNSQKIIFTKSIKTLPGVKLANKTIFVIKIAFKHRTNFKNRFLFFELWK